MSTQLNSTSTATGTYTAQNAGDFTHYYGPQYTTVTGYPQTGTAYIPIPNGTTTTTATFTYDYSNFDTMKKMEERLKRIEKVLAIIELDAEMEEMNKRFPNLKKAYEKYLFLLELHKNSPTLEDNAE